MKIGFAGSDEFSLKILAGLCEINIDDFSLDFILTTPGKNRGRGRVFSENPIFTFGRNYNFSIEIFSPQEGFDEKLIKKISNLDYLIVASFGIIFEERILTLPKYGCINVHPSLLPKWRGAAPIQRAIEAGEKITGVSIMKMVPELDAGPIWDMVPQKIETNDNYNTLEIKLAEISKQMLYRFFKTKLENISYTPQDHRKATYAKKIASNEMEIDWSLSAAEIARKIHAFYPKTCAFTVLNNQRIKIGIVEILENSSDNKTVAGTLAIVKNKKKSSLIIHCGVGSLKINLLQKAGGSWLEANAFINGFKSTDAILSVSSG